MSNLSPEDRKNCEDTFKKFDKSGDGKLSIQEVVPLFRSMGWNEKDHPNSIIIEWFLEADTNISGSIDLNEFVCVMSKRPTKELNEANLRCLFKEFDKDESGNVSAAEFKEIFAKSGIKVSDSDLNSMIKTADTSGDGQINLEEFLAVFKQ